MLVVLQADQRVAAWDAQMRSLFVYPECRNHVTSYRFEGTRPLPG